MARTLGLLIAVAVLCLTPHAQQPPPLANGVYLEITSPDNQPFDMALMISGEAMVQSRAVSSLSRSFPPGTNLAVVLQAAEGAKVSVQIKVQADGLSWPKGASATGRYVTGEVLFPEPRVSAF